VEQGPSTFTDQRWRRPPTGNHAARGFAYRFDVGRSDETRIGTPMPSALGWKERSLVIEPLSCR
jgi:hypothetical protein